MSIGSTPLVGRVPELRELEDALRAAADGRPGAVMVGGEPGVGKSRLLSEFITRARAGGATVLRGGCLDIGGGALPYLPLVEMLRGLVRERGAAQVRALVDPAWPELARVLPALADGVPPRPVARDDSPARLLEAVLRLVDGCSEQAPTVLAIEDLHWVDRSTADLLVFLVRTLTQERVLVVGTYRSDGSVPLRAMLSDLVLSGRCRRRELEPLGAGEIRDMVRDLVGAEPEPSLVQWIVDRSDGNAFFARELLATGEPRGDAVPVGVRDLVHVRLDLAGSAAQQVAGLVAAAGRPVEHALVAAACPLPRDELLGGVRACVEGRLLVVDEAQRYTFRHALVRDAVYSELLPGERAGCHLALAEVLTTMPSLALGQSAGATAELAHHWDIAGDMPRAFAASIAAGAAAAETFGYAEAERQYERALRLRPVDAAAGTDPSDLLAAAADACRWAGHVERAVALVEQALAELGTDRGATVGMLQERRGRYLWELGRPDDSLRAYERACAAFDGEPPATATVWVLAGHATALVQAGRLHDAVRQCREALRVAEQAGAAIEAGRAMNTLGAALTMLGSPGEGVDSLREAVRIAEDGGSLEDVLRGYSNLGYALETAGRLEESLVATFEGVRRSRELGLEATGGAVLLANAASVLGMLGRWDEAEEVAESAGGRRPPPGFDRYRQIVLAELDVGRGRFTEAQTRLGLVADPNRDEPQFAGPVHAVRAEAELWQGRDGAALAFVERGLDAVGAGEDPAQVLRLCALGLRAVADAAARVPGRTPEPAGPGVRLLALAEEAAGSGPLLPAPAATKALCDAEHGRWSGAAGAAGWAAVAARWETLAQPYPAAYARWRQAEAAVTNGERPSAVAPLTVARRLAAGLGAGPLLREIDALARAARLSVEPAADTPLTPPTAPFGLTRRERDVVALLADGLTNRQIARRLFITEKTAGVHVSNILGKIGVSNRGQAAAAARRVGLVS